MGNRVEAKGTKEEKGKETYLWAKQGVKINIVKTCSECNEQRVEKLTKQLLAVIDDRICGKDNNREMLRAAKCDFEVSPDLTSGARKYYNESNKLAGKRQLGKDKHRVPETRPTPDGVGPKIRRSGNGFTAGELPPSDLPVRVPTTQRFWPYYDNLYSLTDTTFLPCAYMAPHCAGKGLNDDHGIYGAVRRLRCFKPSLGYF
ncbi:hypothetical protein BJY52DRAFT_1219595 [Lactarius psammicola]|nr:hypothetical protein BJY52DRAFT_1219595 [Lactarius psammicola]